MMTGASKGGFDAKKKDGQPAGADRPFSLR